MTGFFLSLILLPACLSAADTVSLPVRGKPQVLVRLPPGTGSPGFTVIFLPGDGGWRGTAITFARTIASWGYEVYGFDTKHYLEVFSQDGSELSRDQLAADMRALVEQISVLSRKPVILVGWSQGAGMAVAAGSGRQPRGPVQGILTLGLPQSAVLGWDWKATLATIAHREPDQPAFPLKPLLASVAPTPVWMIHGTDDEYTTSEVGRMLFEAAAEPKHLQEIPGANHRFDGHQDELYRSMKEGLTWIGSR